MIPGKCLWKPLIQRAVTGRTRPFRLTPATPPWPQRLSSPGLYLHVPFCRNLCPYCPYHRVEYDADLFAAYTRAVKLEIDQYAPFLRGLAFTSLYVGGGTPTVHWPGLVAILQHLQETLATRCDVCIELHPANMDTDCLAALREAGVTRLSIGVESISDRLLTRIGRNHDGKTLSPRWSGRSGWAFAPSMSTSCSPSPDRAWRSGRRMSAPSSAWAWISSAPACFYCESKNSGQYHFTAEAARAAPRAAYARGHRALYFTGGEPMLWTDGGADLADMVRYARALGFHVEISQILAWKPSALLQVLRMVR